MADLSYLLKLPPERVINFFKSKGYELSWDWHDVWQESHQQSFTVAKAMSEDILTDIRGAVKDAIEKGQTFEEFQKELKPKLKSKGWWGEIYVVDSKGNAERAMLGSMHRLNTIYRTNMQAAYQTGRFKEQSENTDNRPYWEYVAILDPKTRPEHGSLNGKVFRYDDPFWDSHYPPNGWGCRCRVRALSPDNIKDRGFTIESSKGQLEEDYKLVSKKTGEMRPVTVYTDPVTGKKVAPDVGFSYSPKTVKGNLKGI